MKSNASDCELDLPPEWCQYHDEGCRLHKSCLGCPLPACVYEVEGGQGQWARRQRNQELVRLFTDEGKRVTELARSFGISPRTVQRVLKGHLASGSGISNSGAQNG